MLTLASLHPAGLRLTVALVALAVFGALATVEWRRPQQVVSVVVLALIVCGWLFGATLVWGDPYASKVRWTAGWTADPSAWEWTALLVVALAGVFSLGLALRSFAHGRSRRGWTLAVFFAAAFVAWSVVVRYSPAAAVVVAALAAVALVGVSTGGGAEPTGTVATDGGAMPTMPGGPMRRSGAVPLLLTLIVVGLGWAFFAFGWAVVGREGRPDCQCWADHWGTWQYNAQLLVAVLGAIGLVTSGALFVLGRRRSLMMSGTFAAAAIVAWAAFLITGGVL